ncbi:hypothetical protein TNCV_4187531 [Trichonephila clavipes]|nr:hypothetical protein TNCV_4187531 [Trichonephila clavipes]
MPLSFTWLYPVNSTTLEDTLDKLKATTKDFRQSQKNNNRQGSPLTPKDLVIIVPKRKSKNLQINTGVPEGTVKWRESTEL